MLSWFYPDSIHPISERILSRRHLQYLWTQNLSVHLIAMIEQIHGPSATAGILCNIVLFLYYPNILFFGQAPTNVYIDSDSLTVSTSIILTTHK